MSSPGLENVLGIVGATGYGANILPTARDLSKTTMRDPLLFAQNIRQVYPSGKTRLQAAAKAGDLATVQEFLHIYTNAPGSAPKKKEGTREKMIEMILRGEDTDSSPLILAELNGHEPIVRAFFSVSPRPATWLDYNRLLYGAYMKRNDKLIQDLLFNGADKFPYLSTEQPAGFGGYRPPTVPLAPKTDEERDEHNAYVFRNLYTPNFNLSMIEYVLSKAPTIYSYRISVPPIWGGADREITVFGAILSKYKSYGRRSNQEEKNRVRALILDGLNNCVSVNTVVDDVSLLSFFIIRDDEEIVNILLNSPSIDVNEIGGRGKNPLYYAVQNKKPDLAHRLLEKGAKDESSYERDNSTIFGQAAAYASSAEYNYLFANTNAQKEEYRQEYESARTILDDFIAHGFDPNFSIFYADNWATVLMKAVEGGGPETIRKILSLPGIDKNETNGDVETAYFSIFDGANNDLAYRLQDTTKNREHVRDIVNILRDGGVDPEIANVFGDKPLDFFNKLKNRFVVLKNGFRLAFELPVPAPVAENQQNMGFMLAGGSKRKTRKGNKARRSKGTKKRV